MSHKIEIGVNYLDNANEKSFNFVRRSEQRKILRSVGVGVIASELGHLMTTPNESAQQLFLKTFSYA